MWLGFSVRHIVNQPQSRFPHTGKLFCAELYSRHPHAYGNGSFLIKCYPVYIRAHPFRLNLVLVLACLLAILLFLLDMAGGTSHFWGRYLLPILVAFLWGRRRDIYIVTALASMLVVAGTGPADPLPSVIF